MNIFFNLKNRQFHMTNGLVSYIMNVMENGQIEHLYYGKAIKHRDDFSSLIYRDQFATASCAIEGNLTFSLDYIKREFSTSGDGDYKKPSHQIVYEDGSIVSEFIYKSHKILRKKPKIKGMPSTFIDEDELNKESQSLTLEISLYDECKDLELILYYTIFKDQWCITRHNTIINHGNEIVSVKSALSGQIDFSDSDYELLHLSGAWGRERHVVKKNINHGAFSIGSTRGSGGHQHNPFLALGKGHIEESRGDVYGFSLIYSGNFIGEVEVDHYDITRVSMGINPHHFAYQLNKGDSFETPEMVIVFSDKGLNGMSQSFHKLYLNHLIQKSWRKEGSPILCNNWEGTYFDFTEEKLLAIAQKSKDLGIEMFVLDDGWFGKRNDDTTSLGDWFVNEEKLPLGIKGLSEKVVGLGLKFGLWFEPEMANIESELIKNHPDYLVQTPNRAKSHGRNQYVLDFSRDEVVDNIYEQMAKVLNNAKISYIKWDMNRYITEPYTLSLLPERQGEFYHRYVLGVYRLYDRLVKEFPKIMFESCASGGGRFDPALLYYAPQCWASDDSDAIERLKIQYGTSIVYPLRSIGSHVTKVPNHQLLRKTPLQTRANVAYFGTFGYELDVTEDGVDDKVIKEQIEFYKKHRELLQFGKFYRISSPFEGNITSWIVVSEDKKEALLGVYMTLMQPNKKKLNLKMTGLDENLCYNIMDGVDEIKFNEIGYYGDELMTVGFTAPTGFTGNNKLIEEDFKEAKLGMGDFSSTVYHVKARKENEAK